MGVVEAEPFSVHRIPDVGTVMAEVSQPHMGDHSKEFIVHFRLRETKAETVQPPPSILPSRTPSLEP